MVQQDNLYALVERAAIQKQMPRLDLWSLAATAINRGDLPVEYPHMRMGDGSVPWPAWMVGFQAAVDRGNDPNSLMRYLKMIVLRVALFDRWVRKVTNAPRGPKKGATGYEEPDRRAFGCIRHLTGQGKARSAYGAALILARAGKLAGDGTPESKAKRVAQRYKTARATNR